MGVGGVVGGGTGGEGDVGNTGGGDVGGGVGGGGGGGGGSGAREGLWNIGLLLPLVVIGLFLVVVASCLLWHKLQTRRRRHKCQARGPECGVTSFYRSHDIADDWRSSTRSTTPLQQNSISHSSLIPPKPEFKPQLDKISESPEDKMAAFEQKMISLALQGGMLDDVYSPDTNSTIQSSFRDTRLFSTLSATPYLSGTQYIPDATQSYPNLYLHPQSACSPYHLTWLTPSQITKSDPEFLDTPTILRNSLRRSRHTRSLRMYNNTPWKSPYHPNFNTPTNGSETDTMSPGIVINQTRQPTLEEPGVNIYTETSYTDSDGKQSHENHCHHIPMAYAPQNQNGAHVRNFCGSGIDGRMPVSPCNVGPPVPWPHGFVYACSCEQSPYRRTPHPSQQNAALNSVMNGDQMLPEDYMLSNNTSLIPAMGSSNTSLCHQRGPGSYTSTRAQLDSCEISQPSSVSSTITASSTGCNNSSIYPNYNTDLHLAHRSKPKVPGIAQDPQQHHVRIQEDSSDSHAQNVDYSLGSQDTTNSLYVTTQSAPAALGAQRGTTPNSSLSMETMEWDSFAHRLTTSTEQQFDRMNGYGVRPANMTDSRSTGGTYSADMTGTYSADMTGTPISQTDSSLASVSLSLSRLTMAAPPLAPDERYPAGMASHVEHAGSVSNERTEKEENRRRSAPLQSMNSRLSAGDQHQVTPTTRRVSEPIHSAPRYRHPLHSETQYWI